MIQVQGLTRRYGDTVAVSGLSFSVKEGEIVGFSRPKRRRKNHNYEYDHRLPAPDSRNCSARRL